MAVQIQSRRDTAANWTSNDPTLATGEIGFETDTGKVKVGDGATAWTALDYIDTAISHDSIADVSADDHHAQTHTIVSHDTTGTGANVTTLTDNSMADALHRHSELSASDGSPDAVVQVNANGRVNITNDFSVDTDLLFVDIAGNVGVGIGTGTPSEMLDVVGNAEINGNIIVTGTVDGIDIATDVAANTLKDTNVTTNITVVEAPTNVAIQSSDGTNDTIAAADVTNAGVMTTTMYDEHVVNTAHAIDNTQAHTDYLLNSAADIGVGLSLTGDNASADTTYVPNVLYNTDATPPTASTVPIGTIYVQYTA